MTNGLHSWNDGSSKRAIQNFVTTVTTPGSPGFVKPEARVAVFDNDGTLWCEKPMPVELGFILQRLSVSDGVQRSFAARASAGFATAATSRWSNCSAISNRTDS